MKISFSSDKLKTQGYYPQTGTWYGFPYSTIEKLSPPIPPKENLLRYYRGEDYEWIPDIGCDQLEITPTCNPDVKASGFQGGYDAFGVKWIPVKNNPSLPAFVEPGFTLLDDISNWRSLDWPNPDQWSWEDEARVINETYAGDNRLRRCVLLSGYFERLISIMGFEEASVAMVSDPDSVTEFFNKLTELNLCIMDHMIYDLGCEAIKLHDDWSAQFAPFFSPAVAKELLGTQIKQIAAHAHEKNIIFTHHSCGNGISLLPVYKFTGADAWNAQATAFHVEEAIGLAGDDLLLEISWPLPAGLHETELENEIRTVLKKFCGRHRCIVKFSEPDANRAAESRKLIYKVGRELASVCK